jgi:Uma2 family endonuclease
MTVGTFQPRLPQSQEIPVDPIWRLTVAQYHEMVRHGILTEDDPVEFLEGWLFTKMSKNPSHRIATRRARERLSQLLPAGWYVDAQEPITTSDSEPEPDICVVRGETEDYPDRHPGPADVALVIEIADTTLNRDRTIKSRVYARAGVPTYWIVNLVDQLVEVYTVPSGPAERPSFRDRSEYRAGDLLTLTIEGRAIAQIPVEDLLPRQTD